MDKQFIQQFTNEATRKVIEENCHLQQENEHLKKELEKCRNDREIFRRCHSHRHNYRAKITKTKYVTRQRYYEECPDCVAEFEKKHEYLCSEEGCCETCPSYGTPNQVKSFC
jgi:regulator of replication initiation timing